MPAPGRAPLLSSAQPWIMLDLGYRARQPAFRRRWTSQWMENERVLLQDEVELRKQHETSIGDDFVAASVAAMEQEALRQEKDALATYGVLERSDPSVAVSCACCIGYPS